jgi:single-strand DNA-binding protein
MSSRSLNRVMLIGNLTRDPELRYTPQGTPVCTFGLATNRSWQPSGGGERQESTEFHRIVAWNKLAELCSQLLFKGRKVFVAGRLQTRNWTTAEGQERQTVEIVIDNMIVLDSKRKPGEPESEGYEDLDYPEPVAAPSPEELVASGSTEPAASKAQPATAGAKAETASAKPAKTTKAKSAKAEAKTKKTTATSEEKVAPDDIPF